MSEPKSVRAFLLTDGPSDVPLGDHVAQIGLENNYDIDVVFIDPRRLPTRPRTIDGRLAELLAIDPDFDLGIVHRDAERESREKRLEEIDLAFSSLGCSIPRIPIIPVRMTEAWLIADETMIRIAAGKPRGKVALGLPKVKNVESIPDPKKSLSDAISLASEASGRRLKSLRNQFPEKRRWLIENLDLNGSAAAIPAVAQFKQDVLDTLNQLP